MGGLFGGRPQTETTTAVSAPQLPAYLQPYETQAAGAAQNLYQSGQLSPAYYPGSTVASPSGATQGYFNAVDSLSNGGQPGALQTAATQQQLGVINGNNLNADSNPYLQSAMSAANRGTTDQFMNSILPGINSSFAKSGRSSSDAYGNTVGQAAGQLGRTLADSNSTMAFNNYNNGLIAQQQAAQNAPQLAQGDYANAAQLQASGAQQDIHSQNLADASVDQYNYNANLPQNALQNYINLLNGTAGAVGNGSTSTGIKYGDQTRTQSTLMQGAQLAALFASDIRLKTDIRRIGKMPNDLGIYSFRYKNGSGCSVGVLAQEVLKVKPEAVHVVNGFYHVNYGAL